MARISIPEQPKTAEQPVNDGTEKKQDNGALSAWVQDIFTSFKNARKPFEDMWIECWYNYLAKYQQELNWRKLTEGTEGNSRVFIKATTLKCNTAHAKIMEMAFGASAGEEVPFDIIPERSRIHDIEGTSEEDIKKSAEGFKDRIRSHNRTIELTENIDNGTLELTILGTAVIKGPIIDFIQVKTFEPRIFGGVPINRIDPTINPYTVRKEDVPLPTYKHIPLWSYYVDPNAETNRKSIGEIHFDRMLPSEFLALGELGGYRKDVIRTVKDQATTTRSADDDFKYVQLADNYSGEEGDKDKKVTVLEYWGLVRAGDLRAASTEKDPIEVPADFLEDDLVEALVVLAGDGAIIKACLNPVGQRVFNVCPYKKIPNCIYGHGVAWAMRDSQKMINSIYRMIIDNKALTGPGMLVINTDKLNTKKTKDHKVYPKKTWYIKGNAAPKDAIDVLKFTDVTRDLKELAMDFDRFADEETGIPKLEQGQQASWLNKTMGGMAMLMRRTDVNIRPVIKNIDDFWIEPIIESEAEWFMAMDPDPSIKVPYKVKATGTSTMVANEIKMEHLAKFMEITGKNPQLGIFVDNVKMLKNWASMLDTKDIMRTDDEINKILAEMAQRANEPKDLREFVAMDKLYPELTALEKAQVLTQLGIQPDVQGLNVDQQLEQQKKSAEIDLSKAKAEDARAKAAQPAQDAVNQANEQQTQREKESKSNEHTAKLTEAIKQIGEHIKKSSAPRKRTATVKTPRGQYTIDLSDNQGGAE